MNLSKKTVLFFAILVGYNHFLHAAEVKVPTILKMTPNPLTEKDVPIVIASADLLIQTGLKQSPNNADLLKTQRIIKDFFACQGGIGALRRADLINIHDSLLLLCAGDPSKLTNLVTKSLNHYYPTK